MRRPRLAIEDAAVAWPQEDSPFVKVATLRIPQQTFDSEAQEKFCENLSFTPWHAIKEHQPLGNVNRGRRRIYQEMAALRLSRRGATVVEPTGAETF